MTEQRTRYVGPIISDSRVAEAVARAIATDNGGQAPLLEDRGAYVRIGLPRSCRLTQASLEEELGETYTLAGLESVMPSFAGRIRVTDDEIVWYLEEETA